MTTRQYEPKIYLRLLSKKEKLKSECSELRATIKKKREREALLLGVIKECEKKGKGGAELEFLRRIHTTLQELREPRKTVQLTDTPNFGNISPIPKEPPKKRAKYSDVPLDLN